MVAVQCCLGGVPLVGHYAEAALCNALLAAGGWVAPVEAVDGAV